MEYTVDFCFLSMMTGQWGMEHRQSGLEMSIKANKVEELF